MVSPIAETTTTTSSPALRAATMRSATRLIRSASATEDPPYFCTTSATTVHSLPRPSSVSHRRQPAGGTLSDPIQGIRRPGRPGQVIPPSGPPGPAGPRPHQPAGGARLRPRNGVGGVPGAAAHRRMTWCTPTSARPGVRPASRRCSPSCRPCSAACADDPAPAPAPPTPTDPAPAAADAARDGAGPPWPRRPRTGASPPATPWPTAPVPTASIVVTSAGPTAPGGWTCRAGRWAARRTCRSPPRPTGSTSAACRRRAGRSRRAAYASATRRTPSRTGWTPGAAPVHRLARGAHRPTGPARGLPGPAAAGASGSCYAVEHHLGLAERPSGRRHLLLRPGRHPDGGCGPPAARARPGRAGRPRGPRRCCWPASVTDGGPLASPRRRPRGVLGGASPSGTATP